ncbi:hypothetical protein [Nocardia arthritidis]|uniref:SHOCT domain-containing protein n=1 Tax=Nocardia arthritidis TaxID=228602 RepID=A0A6G9Y5Q3_9NOCA|nr:hypothetical protein [Nocardia arthritidis]QIS08393.1 hypothetical protein F5544_02365 [Nocardia arthritidis]
MNIFDHATYLADQTGWHPWPYFWIFPLLFWTTFIVLAVVLRRRFYRRTSGIGALRTAFARGEISEDEYRSRLTVLREKRGPVKG